MAPIEAALGKIVRTIKARGQKEIGSFAGNNPLMQPSGGTANDCSLRSFETDEARKRRFDDALAQFGKPEIFNTDQGSQFTSQAFTSMLREADVRISMDGRGRWMDNVFIERLWRSLKYECVYLHAFETGSELRAGLGRWITYYNTQRPHSSLAGRTPVEAYRRIGHSDHGGHAPHDLMTRMAA